MKTLSQKSIYFLSLLGVVFLLGTIAYLEKYKGFIPCPLCLLQRYVLIILGSVFLIGSIFRLNKIFSILLSFFAGLIALSGVGLAGRQVWLQHLPPDKFSDCGASLEYMLQAFPLREVFHKVLTGSAECSQIGASFLGLSLAEWSLLSFLIFTFISVWLLVRSILNT